MTLEETCSEIEEELSSIDNRTLLKIFSKVAPEETMSLSDIDNDDMKNEAVSIIMEELISNEQMSSKVYYILFDEKISIESDENDEDYYEEFE